MSVVEYLQTSPYALLATATVLGLVVGSFLNVVVHRLPVMLERDWRSQCAELLDDERHAPPPGERFNVVVPRSRCPNCGHTVRALENVPVLSYLVLRGRCSACGWQIPLRYPAVELLTGLLSAAVVWHFGPTTAGIGALLLTWSLVALSFIDLDTQFLPDVITLPMLWAGLAFNLGDVFASTHASVIGAMAGYLVLWTVYHGFRLLTGKEGMGYGDFKLLAMLGAWLGWQAVPLVVLLSSLVGAVVGIGLIVARRHERSTPIPFGPYLAVAGWVALLWGEDLVRMYLSWGAPPT